MMQLPTASTPSERPSPLWTSSTLSSDKVAPCTVSEDKQPAAIHQPDFELAQVQTAFLKAPQISKKKTAQMFINMIKEIE